jgi:hypothetical protein
MQENEIVLRDKVKNIMKSMVQHIMAKVIDSIIMVIGTIIQEIIVVIGILGTRGMIIIDTIEIGIIMEDISEKVAFFILSLIMTMVTFVSQLENDYFKSLSKMFGKTNM